MANEYLTSTEFKESLGMESETFADDDIARSLESASRGIDMACSGTGGVKRRFYPDADANQVRYYRPTSKKYVAIDDVVTVTSVELDPDGDGTFEVTLTLNTDFVLSPENAAADGRPWEAIEKHPSGGYDFPTAYPRSVKVTGKFGWSAVPPTIVEATHILAHRLLVRKREAPLGFVINVDAAMRTSQSDPELRRMLRGFTRGGRGFG